MNSDQFLIHKNYLFFFGLAVILCFVWFFMPIYPDEVAFEIYSTRFIQDKKIVNGLFAACLDNIKITPNLFYIPAYLVSFIHMNFSIIQIRYLSIVTILLVILVVLWNIKDDSRNKVLPSAFLLTSLIGVSGSGLILVRPESLQLLNILFCLLSFFYIENKGKSGIINFLLTILLFLSASISTYSHPQGILFVPLSFYLIARLNEKYIDLKISLSLLIFTFFIFFLNSLNFFNFKCNKFPGIENFMASLRFDFRNFLDTSFIVWVAQKISRFSEPFLYKSSYTINYLPGISHTSKTQFFLLSFENFFISLILFINLFIPLIFYKNFLCDFLIKRNALFRFKFFVKSRYLFLFMLVSPVFFLIAYDTGQNFYRQFFLNFILAIFASVYLRTLTKKNIFTRIYPFVILGVIFISFCMNYFFFYTSLKNGFSGPSIPQELFTKNYSNEIKELTKLCDLDLDSGRGLVDDLTYQYLKDYPNLYPYTYALVSAQVSGTNIKEIFDEINPNFTLARCGNFLFEANSFPFHHQINDLCCYNFKR
jgi:hypothetical protein